MFLVRALMGPLHLPLAWSEPEGLLLHARPRSAYTQYLTEADTLIAIRANLARHPEHPGDAYEIVSVGIHEAQESRLTRFRKKAS